MRIVGAFCAALASSVCGSTGMRSAKRDGPEELGVLAPKYLPGSMFPCAASDGDPDTSPLRADTAVSVMFGWANPPDLSALNATAGWSEAISAKTPAWGSSPAAR